MMQEILDFLGFDIFTIVWDFIQAISQFISSLFDYLLTFINYFYAIHPVAFAVLIIALIAAAFFGILRLINLLPFF